MGLLIDENSVKIPPIDFDLAILRNQQKPNLWNCVFYFIENDLPYDFLFPYVDGDY